MLITSFARWNRSIAILALTGLLFACNVASVFVQVAGWGNMMLRFAADGDLQQAVNRTFSGAEPCSLCDLATTMCASDRQNESTAELRETPVRPPALTVHVDTRPLLLPSPTRRGHTWPDPLLASGASPFGVMALPG